MLPVSGIFPASINSEAAAYVRRSPAMKQDPKPPQATQPEPSEASARARPRRILVVDDDPAARVLANRVFSEAGFDVTTAQSGFECLEKFRKRPNWFDLIVLDLSMPFMDGEETFRRLRSINPNVIVLLSTGFLTQAQDRVERMLAAGMAGFIRKPHRPDELLAQVQTALERAKMSRVGAASS
jgi:two-component system, cell cycle sensor histidine kinase and response regulator CckA